jgi:NAD(P)H-hydrate epimerase
MEPITFQEVHVLDANSEYRGVPTMTLMENAGKGTAEHILETGGAGKRVLVICGSGNNGGDGFVVARHLEKEAEVEIALLRSRDKVRSEISRANLRYAEEVFIPITSDVQELGAKVAASDILVDAILGIGITGPPRGVYADAVELINGSGKRIISVDIPTGWGTDLAIRPESTVTFHAPKIGMGPECGQVVVKPIGIPAEAVTFAGPGELTLIPKVAGSAHKGDRGNVLVIGGGPYTGAPTLAAVAAHRCGIDLVYVAVPGAIGDVVRAFSMDLIVHTVGEETEGHLASGHLEAIFAMEGRSDAIVIGPGLGAEEASVEMAAEAFRRFATAGKPVVVDADGLKAFRAAGDLPPHPKAVLTPHGGEFAALAGEPMPADMDQRVDAVKDLASALGCTILSKGPVDVISDGRHVKLNDTGNPAMATGGTGDVLSGAVGAFLAKGMTAFDAARSAAFLVGTAGDDVLTEKGHSMLASDLLDQLPLVLARHLRWWTRD